MDRTGAGFGSPDPAPTYHPAGDAAGTGNITTLITGVLEDSSTLIKQHFAMLQAEVKQDVTRVTAGAKYLGVGAFVAAVGFFFVLAGVPPMIHYFFPQVPLWACWMSFGTVLLIAGAIGLLVGKSLMAKFNPVPEKTLNALSENASWLTKPQK